MAPLERTAENNIDPFELSPEQLFGATVISASKTDETWWNAPAAIYVLTNEDIKCSGATSIPEVLRLVTGLGIKEYWQLDLRWGWRMNELLNFDVVGQHLLQDEHQEFLIDTSACNASIPRSFYGKLTWHF